MQIAAPPEAIWRELVRAESRRKATIQRYHTWLVVPTATGCKVVTQESQHGFLTYLQKTFVPNKLHRLHDVWLAKLKARAEAGAAAAGGGKS